MKKNRKNITSIFFCSVLILPLLIIVLLQLWQVYLSNTAFERMEEKKLQTVVVDSDKVIWREAGREVTIDGEYFDLVSWNLTDGKYTFTGVYDEEETAVVNLLQKQSETGTSIIRLMFFGQLFVSLVCYIFNFSLFPESKTQFAFTQSRYQYLFNKNISPPPRLSSLP